MSKIICNARRDCKERFHCGGAKPHLKQDCEPCPFNAKAECVPVEVSEYPCSTCKFEKKCPYAYLMLPCSACASWQFNDEE